MKLTVLDVGFSNLVSEKKQSLNEEWLQGVNRLFGRLLGAIFFSETQISESRS